MDGTERRSLDGIQSVFRLGEEKKWVPGFGFRCRACGSQRHGLSVQRSLWHRKAVAATPLPPYVVSRQQLAYNEYLQHLVRPSNLGVPRPVALRQLGPVWG